MIMLNLDERDAEIIISALLKRLDSIDVDNIILKNKVETLTEKLSCSEIPNSSESEADNNG